MSKLIKCHSCQAEIASDSKACPKCGSPNKKGGCLKVVFGGFLVVVSVMFLIAAGSTEKGGAESASETNKEADAAPAPQKEIAAMPVSKKTDDTASAPKGSDNISKSASKSVSEREKLKVKGLWVGMPADQVLSIITPVIKEVLTSVEPGSEITKRCFDSKGELLSAAILREKRSDGGEVLQVSLDSREPYSMFFRVMSAKDGLVDDLYFSSLFFSTTKISYEDFVMQFIKSYKLALIGAKAIVESGGPNGRSDGGHKYAWICDLPIGVKIQIGKNFDQWVRLGKIESEAERLSKLNEAKKGFN
jgi:hypothetical protein